MPDVIDTLSVSEIMSQTLLDNVESSNHSQVSTQSILDNVESSKNSQTSVQTIREFISNNLLVSSQSSFSFGRIDLPITNIVMEGTSLPSYAIVDGGISFDNLDERTFLEIFSVDALAETVTVYTTYTQDDLNLNDRVISIPSGATKYAGNWPKHIYNRDITKVDADLSDPGTLKLRAFRLI